MKHHDLLHSWGHGKLARFMARGGRAEDFNKKTPDEGDEGRGAEAIRRELNELNLDLPESKKKLKPQLNVQGTKQRAQYHGNIDFPVGDESSMHVGATGSSGRRPHEIRAGFETPIAGGQLRATGSYSPQNKSLQAVYERRFDDGGSARKQGSEYVAGPSYEFDQKESEEAEFNRRLAQALTEATGKEVKQLRSPRSAKDFILNSGVATMAGGASDIANAVLGGVDYLRQYDADRNFAKEKRRGENKSESVMGKPSIPRIQSVPPKVEPYASEKPFMGGDQFRDAFERQGVTSKGSQDQFPILSMLPEFALNPVGPLSILKTAPKIYKGAKTVVQEGLPRAMEMGANKVVSDVRRPHNYVENTIEAVGNDLGQYKPSQFQEYITNQSVGKGSPSPLTTLGGRKTVERRGQGVYKNDAGNLETNPMRSFSVKSNDLSTDKKLRADIATAGGELKQEAMAAHRFVPMATNQIKDATAMMITSKSGPLTPEQVKAIGKQLPGMIVSHNPRTGGIFIAPENAIANAINPEFLTAQEVANAVLGKNAKYQFGKADPKKDLMYMHSSTYDLEGARPPSPAAVAKRQALRRMDQNFVAPEKLQGVP